MLKTGIIKSLIATMLTMWFFPHIAISNVEKSKIDELLNAGINRCVEGDPLAGIKFFEDILKIDQNNYYAYLNRAITYYSLNDYQKALPDFLKCIDIDQKNPDAYFYIGYLKSGQGYFEESIDYFTKSIEIDPTYYSSYGSRAIVQVLLGREDRAIRDLTYAIEINPKYPMFYIVRAQIYELQCECKKAIEDFEKGMSFDPKEFNSNENIAWILATCADENLRNINKAEKYISMEEVTKDGVFINKIKAAISASRDDFKKAVTFQEIAINKHREIKSFGKLEMLHNDMALKMLLEQLQSYKNKKIWLCRDTET